MSARACRPWACGCKTEAREQSARSTKRAATVLLVTFYLYFLLSLLPRDEIPLVRADVDLPRTRNLLLRIAQHLFPLREPTGRARNREEHRKKVLREAHGLIDEAGVEIDVRVELA